MRVDYDTGLDLASQRNPAPSTDEIKTWLRVVTAQETDIAKRRLLEKAAAGIEQLVDELQAYRGAAEIDVTRPKDLRFRGWNMAKLTQAWKKTETTLGS